MSMNEVKPLPRWRRGEIAILHATRIFLDTPGRCSETSVTISRWKGMEGFDESEIGHFNMGLYIDQLESLIRPERRRWEIAEAITVADFINRAGTPIDLTTLRRQVGNSLADLVRVCPLAKNQKITSIEARQFAAFVIEQAVGKVLGLVTNIGSSRFE